MECKLYAGQKVVCIKRCGVPAAGIFEGSTYTVTELHLHPDGQPLVSLAGIDGPALAPGWYHWRFRPLEENKKSTETGMTILKEILERETNHDKQPEKAK